jgi:hypothetical protein
MIEHQHQHPDRGPDRGPARVAGGSRIDRVVDATFEGFGACVLVVAAVACAFFAVSLLLGGVALADPDGGALGATAVDSGWSLFETYGPLWGSVAVAYPLTRHLLAVNESRHWIASGRVLAALAGGVTILGTLIQWHFGGAPASGVLAAVMGALALIWHPTVTARGTAKVASSAAFVVMLSLASGSSSCAARQSVGAGVSAGLDCEAPNIVAFMGDATAFAIRTVEHWISGTGQVDQSGLAADLAKIKTDLGRCAADAAVAALAAKAAASQPGAAAAPMAVDAVQISSTYAQIRSQLGWPNPVRRAAPGGTP